jgi:hypothetical protein
MSLLGSGAVAMWWDMAPAMKAEFEDWHSHEHFPERMNIPGFRRGSRWAELSGGEGFFVLYELEAYDVLSSPAYLARLNAPTPWSSKMMPHHRNMVRSQCRVLESFGGGIGRLMMTVRLSPAQGQADSLLQDVQSRLAGLPERPGLTAAHLLRTETPKLTETTEQRIRGGDAVADWIILVSGYDADVLTRVIEGELSGTALIAAGASDQPSTSLYGLSYSLAAFDNGPFVSGSQQ